MIVHATTVAVEGAGLMISGPAGSGKSSLAIEMLALGADLVSDDRTELACPDDGPPLASAPRTIAGLIEARGVGLLRSPVSDSVRLRAVADLSVAEDERLPEPRITVVAGRSLALLRRVDAPWFAAALMLYLRNGRYDA